MMVLLSIGQSLWMTSIVNSFGTPLLLMFLIFLMFNRILLRVFTAVTPWVLSFRGDGLEFHLDARDLEFCPAKLIIKQL